MSELKNIKVAGFGGQGVMMFGQLLAYCSTHDELNSLWFPSYGPETRGGTANCSVIISKKPINSPVFRDADHLVAFNEPSLAKFQHSLRPNGLILYNSSLIKSTVSSKNGLVVGVPINDIASELGNPQVANMVMLGAYMQLSNLFSNDTIAKVLKKFLGERKAHLFDLNIDAISAGRHYIIEQGIQYA
ncbi:MAG: 2-oxoacid:acceptor oxidoreductase family protein [Candidatus Izemoplasmatales bacterium]